MNEPSSNTQPDAEKAPSKRKPQPRQRKSTGSKAVTSQQETMQESPQESAPPTSTGLLVPASVSRKGSAKLNPGAAEFKPSTELLLPVAQPSAAEIRTETNASKASDITTRPKGGKGNQRQRSHDGKAPAAKKGPAVSPSETVEQNLPHTANGPEEAEMSCTICMENVKFFAVGRCNHHICSMCAVRMRIKSKDKHCAICKEELGVMIVFRPRLPKKGAAHDTAQILRPFNTFGLSEADCDADHANLPGVRIDPIGGFLFVDCNQHFTDIENLKAIVCPLKSCRARFPTVTTLQKHLREMHDNLQLCSLCVENRPLFVSEHTLMTPKQLACHMKGEEFPSGGKGPSQPENTHTAGHPSCQFCTERFFDKAALYYHMQRSYFTCHLCPRQYMFRYYVDAAALREHHHQEHIVCTICAAVPQLIESGVAVAFRDAREYSDHMRHVHNTQVSGAAVGSSGGRTSFRLGASSTYQNTVSNVRRDKHGHPRATVVDLDMGSANPFARPDSDPSVTTRAAAAPRPTESVAHLIPANMRIAGRVTGAGRFAALDSSDLLMQAAAEEHAASEREAQLRSGKKSIRLDRDQSFPALEVSAALADEPRSGVKLGASEPDLNTGAGWGASASRSKETPKDEAPPLPAQPVAGPAAGPSLHPMSLLHSANIRVKELQQRKEAEAAARAKEEKQRQEDKRVERNLLLASALLGGPSAKEAKPITLTAADVGATLTNKSYVRSLVAPLEHLGWSESELMRPIYPPVLVSWARLNKTELLKIEKKLYTLMTDPQLNSIQLKPMDRGKRVVVHQLSRMYLLNSYEFDAEPNRYVSLVKQVDSYLPACPLSRAAALPAFVLPGENGEELPDVPVIFLTLSSERYSAGLVNTNSSISAVGKRAGGGSAPEAVRVAFTTAEIVGRVNGLLESPDLWRAWYQHAMAMGGQELEPEASAAVGASLPAPPPPPGFAATSSPPAPARKPRALSDLPVPRLTGLIPAGASTIGLRFEDRASAQLALLFLQYCLTLHNLPSAARGAPQSPVQAGLSAVASTLSAKQAQELMVLSVFNQNPGFEARSVAEIVFGTPLSGQKAVVSATAEPQTVPAALDRRHYAPRDVDAVRATSVTAERDDGIGKAVHAGGWQQQAVKTRRFEADAAIADCWEDFDPATADADSAAAKEDPPRKPSAADAQDPETAGEWEQFLQEKRAKAQAEGAAPRYEAKRSASTQSSTKYVPPSARKTGGLQVVRPPAAAVAAVSAATFEEDYDFCDHTAPSAAGAATQPSTAATVYATDYLDSEEAFEEFLAKTRLEHVNNTGPAEVRAVPYNALSRVTAGTSGSALGGVAAVAVPIRDDMSEEEAARQAIRQQLQRDQRTAQLNRFGVLDEDEDDGDD